MPSTSSRRCRPRRPAVAQVRINGATTSTPQASPSVQVRNTCPSSSAEITSPSCNDNGPIAALTTAATSAQTKSASTSATRSSPPRPPVRRRRSSAATTSATVFPTRLGEHRPQRGREVAEEQIADHDRGPQAHAVEEQHGEAETGRRPQRGHRAIEVGELEADATGDVVRERHDRDSEQIERRPHVLPATQGIDLLSHRGGDRGRLRWPDRALMASLPGLPVGTARDGHGVLSGRRDSPRSLSQHNQAVGLGPGLAWADERRCGLRLRGTG